MLFSADKNRHFFFLVQETFLGIEISFNKCHFSFLTKEQSAIFRASVAKYFFTRLKMILTQRYIYGDVFWFPVDILK